jgi:hypothetical protein
MSRGTHSMICMLCDTRVTCPWEEEIEHVAMASGWIELPKTDRRRSPHNVCSACASELAAVVVGRAAA